MLKKTGFEKYFDLTIEVLIKIITVIGLVIAFLAIFLPNSANYWLPGMQK